MPLTLSKVHHVGILVSDFGRSLAFYTKLLGKEPKISTVVENIAEFDRQVEAEGARARVAFYEVDNTSVELIEFTRPKEPRASDGDVPHVAGHKHLCFFVDDCRAAYDEMVSDGYDFIAEPCGFADRNPDLKDVTFAYFRDPDGNVLEILEDPKQKGVLSKAAEAVGLS